jgi:sec-independent protein translocase protein TatB
VFDIGWSEMAVILLVALVVIGPRDLPRVARSVGRWVAKGRAMAREFQTAIEDMAREAELDKVKDEIEKAGRTNLGKSIEKTIDPTGELGRAFDPKAKSGPKKGKSAPAKPVVAAKDAPAADVAAQESAADPRPETAAKAAAPAAVNDGERGAGNGAVKEAAPASVGSGEPASAPPAEPDAAAGKQEGTASRSRAQTPERETVPADPS